MAINCAELTFGFSLSQLDVETLNSDDVTETQLEDLWSIFDRDNSGILNKDDANEFLKSAIRDITGKEPTEYQVERDYIKMDLDNSGHIDKEKAVKYLKGVKIGMQLKAITGRD